MRRVYVAVVVILLAVAVAAYVILARNSPQVQPVMEKLTRGSSNATARVLRIALGDWGLPSPFKFYPRGPGYVLTSFVFDTLVWKDEKGVIPWLAESWESREGGRVWVFHLRKGVRWQDGRPLTARDVVFSIHYYLEHGWHWKNVDPRLVRSVRLVDNYTVEIILSKPMPLFLEEFASTLFILPEHIWRSVANPYKYSGPEAVLGSGPYRLVSYKPGEGYVFEANRYWWLGRQKFDKVIVTSGFQDPQRLAAALAKGEVDTGVFMGTAYPILRKLLEEHPDFRVEKGPMYWVLFLGFNLAKEPYMDKRFRIAIAHAINTTELILKSMGSLEAAVPGSPGYIPPYSEFYEPSIPRYKYDPVTARKLLESIGFSDVDGDGCLEYKGEPFKPLLVTVKSFARDALIVANMLRRVGVCIEVKTLQSWKQLDAVTRSGHFDMVIMGHGATGNDPLAFTWFFSGRFGLSWRNETYEKLVGELVNTTRINDVYKIARMLQRVIAENLPRIPLYYPNIFVVTRPGVDVHWFFTRGGIDGGIPLPYNKLALIERVEGGG